MTYDTLKHAHIGMAYLSIALFVLRGILMWTHPAALRHRWWKVAPHVFDSLLFIFAMTMLVWVWGNPFHYAWLTVKIIAVLVYIGLGAVALKCSKAKRVRAAAFFMALLVLFYIVSVAKIKLVWPF